MEQDLEFEGLLALVAHLNDCLETLTAQGNAVDDAEIVWPLLAKLLW
jgi:hypothetical protein